MREGPDALQQGAVQALSDTIELRSVMCGEFPHCTGLGQMLIKGSAEVLAPTVRMQDFDGLAMLLHGDPRLV